MEGKIYSIYFEGLRKAVRNPNLSPSAKALLTDLILYAGQNGKCFPSEITLAKDLHLTDRHIRTLLVELLDNRLIKWRKGKPGQSNRYSFSPDIYALQSRKSTSDQSGALVPIQTGNTVPTKVISEGNHIKCSQVLLQFEETFKRKCTDIEVNRINGLCQSYSEEWVLASILEASKRHYEFVKIGLLDSILQDWNIFGKPIEKPKFRPCGLNGCVNGYRLKPDKSGYLVCECKEKYEKGI